MDVVKVLLESGASIEDHNENGHTPLMEAGSAGHVEVARVLLENGAGINTHSNEFKESALTLACYKGRVTSVEECQGRRVALNMDSFSLAAHDQGNLKAVNRHCGALILAVCKMICVQSLRIKI